MADQGIRAVNRGKIFGLKFAMGGANALANMVGAVFVQSFASRLAPPMPEDYWQNPLIEALDVGFTPFAFLIIFILTYFYERPIHRYLDAVGAAQPIPPPQAEAARRRLLNEPLITVAADLGIWTLATIVWSLAWWWIDAPRFVFQQTIFNCVSIGLITAAMVFFLQEHILQKRLAPLFFPEGGLSRVPETRRIRIRTRLAALLLAINIIPLASVLILFHRTTRALQDPQAALDLFKNSVLIYGLIFIAVGLFLTGLVSRNLSIPFLQIIATLRGVRNGRFDRRVQVTTNDEIGYTGDVINEMTAGLRERERMQQSLELAMEVQQNLLPKTTPAIPGLDIAGASVYCEETGGDYFDYFEWVDARSEACGVAVADVAEHGIPSAMLMTTVRAFLRQRLSRRDELAGVVGDVNRQLVRDVEETGRFVTLFLADIDRPALRLRWVNAGHDAAMVYDRGTDSFSGLGRTGLPIGVTAEDGYEERELPIAPGQILLVGTDGIWEAQNTRGEMFGKPRLQQLVRRHADSPATALIAAVIEAVDRFCHPLPKADDLTLVVVKVMEHTA
ncbi:MAG: SpoIIE family protein phosphatase [Desulfobacterales bacterium]